MESIAQTASGPGNWLTSSAIHISENFDDAAIKTAIQNNKLGSGTAPTDFDLVLTGKECGNFIVVGALEKDISYDESTGTLTFLGNSDASVFLKSGLASSNGKIVIQGENNIKLNDIKLSAADALAIQENTKITYSGVNQFGGIRLESGKNVIYEGTGRLEADSFSADDANMVIFSGGVVVIGNDGSGALGTNVKVIIDKDNKASVAAAISPNPMDYGDAGGQELYATPALP